MAIVGYWRLNGDSNDASGNGNNGSDTNITYSQANGVLNGGAGVNGNGTITLSNSISLNQNSSRSFICLIKIDQYPAAYCTIFRNGSGSSWGYSISFRNNSGTYSFNTNVVTTSPLAEYSTVKVMPVTLNKWYYLTSIFDSSAKTLFLYIDTVYGNSVNVGSGLRIGDTNSYMCSYEGIGDYLTGCIDNAILFNTAIPIAYMKNEYARIKGFF